MDTVSTDSINRFTDRVGDYSQYRPGYPTEAIDWLFDQISLDESSCIADVGSGTGIFTKLLIAKGVPVFAVEPNDAMRCESDELLGQYANYSSVSGTAESTELKSNSIDLITAAQAFHWFELAESKIEFKRILKPGGNIALVWNRRDSNGSEFLSQYEELLKSRIPEYNKVTHGRATDDVISEFLGPQMTITEFRNYQDFDLEGLKGRLLSSSYCPAKGKSGHEDLMDALTKLYDSHADQYGVRFDYCTQIYTV